MRVFFHHVHLKGQNALDTSLLTVSDLETVTPLLDFDSEYVL